MQVTFELPIPEGYELAEPVPRVPLVADVWCTNLGNLEKGTGSQAMWILREKWVWPEWLKDGDLEWCAHQGTWLHRNNNGLLLLISRHAIQWTPPPDKNKVYRSSDYRTESK